MSYFKQEPLLRSIKEEFRWKINREKEHGFSILLPQAPDAEEVYTGALKVAIFKQI